jgi:hypothetical protein
MSDPISFLNILVPMATSVLGVLLGLVFGFLTYRQKNRELEQQFSAQKEQLRLLSEQVEHEHLKVESELENIRKANLSPEDQAGITVSSLPAPTIDKSLENWTYRSPYIVGLPISDPSHYFRNKDQVEDFYGRVLGPQLNCLSILGARRSGKTSFVNLLCHPHVRQQYLTPMEIQRIVVVNLNLQSGITSPGLFFRYLVLKTIEAAQRHREPHEIKVNFPPAINEQYVSSFFKGLRENGWRIILILDELEQLGKNDSFDVAFFDFLRSLSNDSDGRIAWVTTSYRDVDKIQYKKGKQDTSAFFNLFNQRIFLGNLSPEEARKLISDPVKEKIIYEDEDVDFLIRLAGLMPFPLQASASLLYQDYIKDNRGIQTHQQLERLFAGNMGKFYEHYWQHFEPPEQVVLKKIAHEKRTDSDENRFVRDLMDYGFLINPQTISSEAFRDWIRSQ